MLLGEAGSPPNPYAIDRELGAPPPVPVSQWGPLPPDAAAHIVNMVTSPRGLNSQTLLRE